MITTYSLENRVTVYEYLTTHTNLKDRCDILEGSCVVASCVINEDKKFTKYLDEDLLYNTYVQSVNIKDVIVTTSEGTTEIETRHWIYIYPEDDLC